MMEERYKRAYAKAQKDRWKLQKQNERYRKALMFYARSRHVAYCLYGDSDNDLVSDYGEVAREALEESE